MKKIILKIIPFVMPFLLLYTITISLYKTDKGDLLRIGYIMDNSNYRTIFTEARKDTTVYYDRIATLDEKPKQHDILVIGDSFSDRKTIVGNTYVNYLSKNEQINLLLFDKKLTHHNPIQTLIALANGDVLDSIKPKYIILQSVERAFAHRFKDLKFQKVLMYDSLVKRIKYFEKKQTEYKATTKIPFFSKSTIKVPIYQLFYAFFDNPLDSKVYKVATTESLFTNKNKQLLFYYEDLQNIALYNDKKFILKVNEALNRISDSLQKRDIQLIVLPSPDKYDMYYEYIKYKDGYEKSLFYNHLDKTAKNYLYLNPKKVFDTNPKKDFYFYDDTHWSPVAARIIAVELEKIILK